MLEVKSILFLQKKTFVKFTILNKNSERNIFSCVPSCYTGNGRVLTRVLYLRRTIYQLKSIKSAKQVKYNFLFYFLDHYGQEIHSQFLDLFN